ncbi:MAG: aconitase family protein, partial [Planctomycetota bacterium]|nr:aconitase family protein [Planctomycetota bacterium]
MSTPRTMLEKIIAQHLLDGDAGQGGFVEVSPARVMTHDNTGAVIPKFRALCSGAPGGAGREPARVAEPWRLVFALDHDIQNHTPENLGKYAAIERFAREQGVEFHRAGSGIGHQVMIERGHVRPGWLVMASDSHANMYGAMNAAGVPIVRSDAAVLWATGRAWWRVPGVVRVELTGALREGVSGKDVIIALCGAYPTQVQNRAVEFGGEGLSTLSVAERMSIANMTTEWGAIACVMEGDCRLRDFLVERGLEPAEFVSPDAGARYEALITLDLSSVGACVAGPNSTAVVRPLDDISRERVRIDRAYLLSCVNARLEDFAKAAAVVRGRRFAEHVKFFMAAASAEVERLARDAGYWNALLDAGARELPPGCGPCIGLGEGVVGAGEVAISATNRNYAGRMGDRSARVYLASVATVVESAIAGHITGESEGVQTLRTSIEFHTMSHPNGSAMTARASTDAPRASARRSRVIVIHENDVNTDAIYAGKWTYQDSMSADAMARVVFENLDPGLAARLRPGDVLLAGERFGVGSSREQAATALIAAGVSA